MNKEQARIAKIKQKEINRTLKKAKISKSSSQEEINEQLITYIAGLKKDFHKVRFSDEQTSDPEFLMKLYRANLDMTLFQRPDPQNEELQENINFMMEYIKLRHKKEMAEHNNNNNWWSEFSLKWIVKNYTKAMTNPEFIAKLAEQFPNINILPIVKNFFITTYSMLDKDRKEKESQDQARYKECLANLPIELLCAEAKKYGYKALLYIPNDVPNFNQVVSAGIECDGFRSLEKLDITQVLDNKDLIVKAYEKDGIQALAGYIQHTLSPMRTHYYMCHGEEHDYTEYDKRYEEVQKALKADSQIHFIFKKEELLAKQRIENQNHLDNETQIIESAISQDTNPSNNKQECM